MQCSPDPIVLHDMAFWKVISTDRIDIEVPSRAFGTLFLKSELISKDASNIL